MLSLLNSRSIIKDRVALDKAPDLPSICIVSKTKPVFLIDRLGILIGSLKDRRGLNYWNLNFTLASLFYTLQEVKSV